MGILDNMLGKISLFHNKVSTNTKKSQGENLQVINITSNNCGSVRIFDLFPSKVRNWNRGTVYWKFETTLEYCNKVNKGDTIGTIELTYTKKRDSATAFIKERKNIPIIANTKGVIKFEDHIATFYKKKGGAVYMDQPFFLEKNKDTSCYNPVLFLFSESADNLVLTETPYTIEIDPITKDCFIKGFEKSNIWNNQLCHELNYNFEGGQYYAYLVFRLRRLYNVVLRKIRDLIILFDSAETLTLSIDKKMTEYDKSDWMDTKILLSKEQLNMLTTKTIKLVRYSQTNGDFADLSIEEAYAEYFKAYSARFAQALQECGWNCEEPAQLNPTEDKVTERNLKESACYVYLMHDESNGYYKIGISNHPKYREHTLQSEKPTIVLITAKQFPIRSIAEAYEAALHKTYASKRLRGEWFNLEEQDVEHLKVALQ